MSESLPGILWLVVLLLVNAFFVGAEFADEEGVDEQQNHEPEDSGKGLGHLALTSLSSVFGSPLATGVGV